MSLVITSGIISVLFIAVGGALSYVGVVEPYLGILISSISMLLYGVWCLVCIRQSGKRKTKFYAISPIFLGLVIAIILGSIGLNSGTINLAELGVILILLVVNAVLIRKNDLSKNT